MTATSSPPSFSSALPSSSSTSPTVDRQIDHRPITPTARRLVGTAENGNTQNVSLDGEFIQCNAEAVDLSQNESENGLAAAFKVIYGDFHIIVCASSIILLYFFLTGLLALIAAFTQLVPFLLIIHEGN